MTLVSLERIERRFGDVEVLSGANLRIDEGDRVGIVGDNGSGKTTLVRILAGVDEPDRGERNPRRDLRLSYAEQVPRLTAGMTVHDWVLRGDGSFGALEDRIRKLEHELAAHPGDERLLAEYGDLQIRFGAGGGLAVPHVCEPWRVRAGDGERCVRHRDGHRKKQTGRAMVEAEIIVTRHCDHGLISPQCHGGAQLVLRLPIRCLKAAAAHAIMH